MNWLRRLFAGIIAAFAAFRAAPAAQQGAVPPPGGAPPVPPPPPGGGAPPAGGPPPGPAAAPAGAVPPPPVAAANTPAHGVVGWVWTLFQRVLGFLFEPIIRLAMPFARHPIITFLVMVIAGWYACGLIHDGIVQADAARALASEMPDFFDARVVIAKGGVLLTFVVGFAMLVFAIATYWGTIAVDIPQVIVREIMEALGTVGMRWGFQTRISAANTNVLPTREIRAKVPKLLAIVAMTALLVVELVMFPAWETLGVVLICYAAGLIASAANAANGRDPKLGIDLIMVCAVGSVVYFLIQSLGTYCFPLWTLAAHRISHGVYQPVDIPRVPVPAGHAGLGHTIGTDAALADFWQRREFGETMYWLDGDLSTGATALLLILVKWGIVIAVLAALVLWLRKQYRKDAGQPTAVVRTVGRGDRASARSSNGWFWGGLAFAALGCAAVGLAVLGFGYGAVIGWETHGRAKRDKIVEVPVAAPATAPLEPPRTAAASVGAPAEDGRIASYFAENGRSCPDAAGRRGWQSLRDARASCTSEAWLARNGDYRH